MISEKRIDNVYVGPVNVGGGEGGGEGEGEGISW